MLARTYEIDRKSNKIVFVTVKCMEDTSMTIRSAFNFYSHPGQQRLHQDLINESIQIIGIDAMYFLLVEIILISFTEHLIITTYDTVYTIEVYLETYQGFTGDQSFISKFGLEIT